MGQDLTLKEKFVQWMCPLIFVCRTGAEFPYGDIVYDPKFRYIRDDIHQRTLKRKMKNLLKMLNDDINVGFVDIETELWDKI